MGGEVLLVTFNHHTFLMMMDPHYKQCTCMLDRLGGVMVVMVEVSSRPSKVKDFSFFCNLFIFKENWRQMQIHGGLS